MMNAGTTNHAPSRPRRGFTLTELLVVIVIIVLLTAATLPVVLPALSDRQADEGARILQAAIASAQAEATRARAPRGIRLLPDPILNGIDTPAGPTPLATSRMIPIEPAPDYSEGLLSPINNPIAFFSSLPAPFNDSNYYAAPPGTFVLAVHEVKVDPGPPPTPNAPTGWFWNLRQGDKIRIGDSGRLYTIAGPIRVSGVFNSERYLNFDASPTVPFLSLPVGVSPPVGVNGTEFLFLVNGQDDDGDGYIDEGFDGLNNDNDFYPPNHPLAGQPCIDPGFNGIDDDGDGQIDEIKEQRLHFTSMGPIYDGSQGDEFEIEQFVMAPATRLAFDTAAGGTTYLVKRRPVPSPRSAEVALPAGLAIDLTTCNAPVPERSRLPVDPLTRSVDLLFDPRGDVVPPGPSSPSLTGLSDRATTSPFLIFWLADREDIHPPSVTPGFSYLLPMPQDTPGYNPPNNLFLKRNRRVIALSRRNGDVAVSRAENFSVTSPGQASSSPGIETGQPTP
jgi:prepilin-type N-terminal cleavage/methylation domain-containing protein